MWMADRVEKLVPYLRRYARASTGDATTGDTCVETVLKAILELSLEVGFDDNQVNREGLFRMLEQEIQKINPDPRAKARRALLLIAVEGLPEKVAARVLGVDNDALVQMVEAAEQDFAESTATNMMIIEDEPLISAQLKRLAESLGHNVVGVASTASAAVALNAQHQPDIVLCDIMLADGSLGTDAIAEMDLAENVPVVFVTAYPEKYLATTNEGPSYLITKPFDQNYLKAVIGHALLNVQGTGVA
ncbi:MAG: response regulator [Henriciella sp.]